MVYLGGCQFLITIYLEQTSVAETCYAHGAQVPSSPSEPDPMMWSEGVRSLGDYMAAKALQSP